MSVSLAATLVLGAFLALLLVLPIQEPVYVDAGAGASASSKPAQVYLPQRRPAYRALPRVGP